MLTVFKSLALSIKSDFHDARQDPGSRCHLICLSAFQQIIEATCMLSKCMSNRRNKVKILPKIQQGENRGMLLRVVRNINYIHIVRSNESFYAFFLTPFQLWIQLSKKHMHIVTACAMSEIRNLIFRYICIERNIFLKSCMLYADPERNSKTILCTLCWRQEG